MKRRIARAIGGVLAVALFGLCAYEVGMARANGIPTMTPIMAYSGTLTNGGQPVTTPTNLALTLYNNASGGMSNVICSTSPTSITPDAFGRFRVPLDSCIAAIHQSADVWVQVLISGVGLPLAKVGAVPYAVEADTATNYTKGSPIAALVPPGTVIAFAGVVGGAVSPPPGWLVCNGSAVSRTTYAALFTAIGTTAGAGDNATTFNLPDYRGRFLRGVDNGAGQDPDATSRVAMNPGGSTGDNVGTVEDGGVVGHTHGVTATVSPGGAAAVLGIDVAGSTGFSGITLGTGSFQNVGAAALATVATGGTETRPVNAAVNFLIKY